MKLSLKWLSDYVKIDVPTRQYAEDLTMSGSKVEGYERENEEISHVVVGKVLSVDKHPNADSLVICQLDVGQGEPVQIVTGATNVVPGALVPVALDGSTLPGGKQIRRGKLRGEVSSGMLCSLSELGLTEHDFPYAQEDGIFLLKEECTIGQDIAEAIGLNDTVVEFEITSNRPDCLSVLGLARETAATYRVPFAPPAVEVKGCGEPIGDRLKVHVENAQLCTRYCAAMVRNVKIGPSPRWIRERLRASGVRPINNIVDITNYVMLEYGHPMHAFDLRNVAGGEIIVRNASPGETITTLDGVVRTLSPEMLVIADAKAPSAVAGIMGGEYSGVYEDTATVVFEAACFDPQSVRITSKKLGLRTESSSRFEKGLDTQNCMPALQRACQLVELLGAGEVYSDVIDRDYSDKALRTLPLEADWINSLLGVSIPADEMEAMLRSLGFTAENGTVTVPSFRADIESKADLAEEVARLYGYNKIPNTALRGSSQARPAPEQRFERTIVSALLGQGCHEVITYSFISPKSYDRIRLAPDSELRKNVVISNPLGEDTSVMRRTTIPSMLDVLARNYNNRNASASLFEIATEYIPQKGELPREEKRIVLGQYGEASDFFTLKGVLEAVLEATGVSCWEMEAVTDHPTFHPGRCAKLLLDGREAGILGEIHPLVCENYGADTRLYVACVELPALFANADTQKQYRPLPKYPASTRDLALVCDDELPVAAMQKAIAATAGKNLESLELFDVYRGKQVGEGKKSVAFSLTLRAPDRTLTDEECDRMVSKSLAALEKIGAHLRG